MNPGDRPSLPLTAEPAPFLHPTSTGTVPPRAVQPAPGRLLLEEEPALWPGAAGRVAPARAGVTRPAAPRRTPAGGTPDVRALPATGASTGLGLTAGLALGLAALLQRRRRVADSEP